LALSNKINFQMRQQDVPLRNAYDNLIQVRKRAEMRVRRIKQQSDANLKRAAKLFKDFFGKNAPASEKELFNIAQENLANMKTKLDAFSNKASTGKYPGGKEIDQGIVLLAGLTEQHSSFSFIELFLSSDNDLLDFEEDYQDLENFFETQFSTWQKLARALNQEFDRNRNALEKDDKAKQALHNLQAIYNNDRPYKDIRNIEPLISDVAKINETLLQEKREHALGRIQLRIDHVQQQIKDAAIPSDISNKALYPLQSSLKRLSDLQGIAEIHQEITEAASLEEDAYELINQYIELEEKRRAQAEKEKPISPTDTKPSSGTNTGGVDYPAIEPTQPPKVATPTAKKIVSVDTSSVMRDVNQSGVIETEQDIDTYLNALRDKLSTLVAANNKVRIK